MLNIEKYPCKPQYSMCSETPLILFDCDYSDVEWRCDQKELEKIVKHLQGQWLIHQTKANVIKAMIDNVEAKLDKKPMPEIKESTVLTNHQTLYQPYAPLQGKSLSVNYIKLADRRKAHSLDARVDHYVKKRRLTSDVYDKINENNKIAQIYNIYKPRELEADLKKSSNDEIRAQDSDTQE